MIELTYIPVVSIKLRFFKTEYLTILTPDKNNEIVGENWNSHDHFCNTRSLYAKNYIDEHNMLLFHSLAKLLALLNSSCCFIFILDTFVLS